MSQALTIIQRPREHVKERTVAQLRTAALAGLLRRSSTTDGVCDPVTRRGGQHVGSRGVDTEMEATASRSSISINVRLIPDKKVASFQIDRTA